MCDYVVYMRMTWPSTFSQRLSNTAPTSLAVGEFLLSTWPSVRKPNALCRLLMSMNNDSKLSVWCLMEVRLDLISCRATGVFLLSRIWSSVGFSLLQMCDAAWPSEDKIRSAVIAAQRIPISRQILEYQQYVTYTVVLRFIPKRLSVV